MHHRLARQHMLRTAFAVIFLPRLCWAGDGTCQTGPGLFDYGPHRDNAEAEYLAMTLAGELRAPDEAYDRILRDLQFIRNTYPFLESEFNWPEWEPGNLIVRLDPDGPWPEYEALNTFYQLTSSRILVGSLNIILLQFCDSLNAIILADEYDTLPGVIYASPDSYGGEGTKITVSVIGDTYGYLYENGYGDCMMGCGCWRIWDFEVSLSGDVTLVSYVEDPPECIYIEDIACCFADETCAVVDMATCLAGGGTPLAAGAPCSQCVPPIPAVSEWGIVISALLLVVAGTIVTARMPSE